jgi:DNA-binding NtrC family response regulator
MQRLARTIVRVGAAEVTVLIIGESGTGKELVASRLHALSARAKGPVPRAQLRRGVAQPDRERAVRPRARQLHRRDAAARGLLRARAGGTLFLDEITEMPLDLQVRLLRVLETRRSHGVGGSDNVLVNVRVIAATNRDPRDAVRQGRLREDLLYRLQVVPIEVPPLRQRAGDVRVLALHFLAQLNQAVATPKSFSEAALARLEGYHWPGNVRELYNLVQRAFVLSDGPVITHPHVHQPEPRDRPPPCGHDPRARSANRSQGSRARDPAHAAPLPHAGRGGALLGVSTKTLYNKLRLYGRSASFRKESSLPAGDGDSAWGTTG